MAPLPVIANTFRCAAVWTAGGGATAINVMHVESDVASTATDVNDEIQAAWEHAMIDPTSSAAHLDRFDITPLDGTSPTQSFPTGSTGKWVGAGGGDYSPANCYLIKMTTAIRGRSYRGRLFMPFVAEAQSSAGQLDLSNVSACTAAWVAFTNQLVTDGFALVVASYKLAVATQVLNIACEPSVATQRKRQTRVRV